MSELPLLLRCAALLTLFALCQLVGACLVAPRDGKPGLGMGVALFVTGFCVVSFLFLLTKLLASTGVVVVVAGSVVALLYRWRRPTMVWRAEYSATHTLTVMAVVFVGVLPTAIMGIRMGVGDYPPVFFAVDTPYFLQHVHSLMTAGEYPPPSLEVTQLSYRYHYGIQAFTALASVLTGLKPHLVMFGVLVPALEFLTGLLAYDICRRLTGTHGRAVLALTLVLFGSTQYLTNYFGPSMLEFITRSENYGFRYSHPPTTIGLLASLCIVRALMEFEDRHARYVAILLVALMPIFKMPYVVSAGAGLTLVYLYEFRRQLSVERVLELVVAGILSFGCLVVFSANQAAGGMSLRLDAFGFAGLMSDTHEQTMLVFGAVILFTAVWKRVPVRSDGLARLGVYVAASYLLFAGLGIENQSLTDQDFYTLFDVVVSLGVLWLSGYLVGAWFGSASSGACSRSVAVILLVGLAGPGLLSHLHHIYIVSVEPKNGHEYVDNRAVADALSRIPLEGTLIATNDLRYPANDYRRDNRQFQLAAVFGHRNMASNLAYAGNFAQEETAWHEGANQLFQRLDWPAAEIARLRQEVGLTHLLIHKRFVHGEVIPLTMVYENQDYAVYLF